MEWAIAAAAALGIFLYGRSHSWWGGAPQGAPIVCDLESDMPDTLKQAVMAQVASQTNVATLQSFAAGLAQQNYIQAAYCLMNRAWVLSGSHPPAPTPPTAAQITAAQAARAAAAGNLGQTSLGQMQVAPGTPSMSAPVGTLIAVVGATPFDPASNPSGFSVSAQPTVASALNGTTYALVGPGTLTFNWSSTSSTVITATPASASTTPAAAAAAAAKAPPTTTSGITSVPGLDPNSIQAAVDSLGTIPTATRSMPSSMSGPAHRNHMV